MKKRLGSVIQTAVALLLCLATALCVTQLQTGRAPQEEAHAASRTDNRCGVAAHGLRTGAEQPNRNDIAANTGGAGRSTAATSDT